MRGYRYTHSRVVDGRRLIWDVERLWRLAEDLPVITVTVDSFQELDRDCWFCGDEPTVRAVAEHCRRIMTADLSLSILLHEDGSLMDGGHRIARAVIDGISELPAVRFDPTPEPDTVDPL